MNWTEVLDQAEKNGVRVKSVYQEEMQKSILTALSRKGCFSDIVFHGGTALRLFHGNPRFSEDIDLIVKEGVDHFDLSRHMKDVAGMCMNDFPFLDSVEARAQKVEPELQRYVLKTISDDPRQRIRVHIELANVPSYQNSPRILDFPPYQPAIRVEEASEILADKVRALGYRPFLKGRDLWDVYFLNVERSVKLEWDLVVKKIDDYREEVDEIEARYRNVEKKIEENGLKVLSNEMDRFLPRQVLDSYKPIYDEILDSVIELISSFNGSKESDSDEDQ
ncbi:MAG: nucleotidyl transferase AbiEii/AbiGii toxin family protein [Thermoplasmatota archaeon]